MKSILMSIQPKWCELIASGKKTVEVRKTKPKLETPFKCYIYCTVGKDLLTSTGGEVNKLNEIVFYLTDNKKIYELNGKVIGEFVCDTFIIDKTFGHDALFNAVACLSDADAASYCLNKEMYGWHISDLVIYDEPKELSEFYHYCGDKPKCDGCEAHYFSNTECGKEDYCCSPIDGCKPLKRPPQSWCYVEERK